MKHDEVTCYFNLTDMIASEAESIKNLSRMGMQPIDEGGPTRQFIEEFCSQMRYLAVLIPIKTDHHTLSASGVTSYLEVNSGARVEFKTEQGSIKATVIRKIQLKKSMDDSASPTQRYILKYHDKNGSETKIILDRPSFSVKEYPVFLFHMENDACFPRYIR